MLTLAQSITCQSKSVNFAGSKVQISTQESVNHQWESVNQGEVRCGWLQITGTADFEIHDTWDKTTTITANGSQQAFSLRGVMNYGHSFMMGWLQVMCWHYSYCSSSISALQFVQFTQQITLPLVFLVDPHGPLGLCVDLCRFWVPCNKPRKFLCQSMQIHVESAWNMAKVHWLVYCTYIPSYSESFCVKSKSFCVESKSFCAESESLCVDSKFILWIWATCQLLLSNIASKYQ